VQRTDSDTQRRPSPNALSWIRETIRTRGPFGAFRYYVAGAFALMRDLLPEKRKSRYGDIEYDFDNGVDTTWGTLSLRTRVRELLSGAEYQPSEPNLFREILCALPVSVEGFTFVDLGSGKGRTLLLASDYPFRRIIGVELLSELHQVAVKNIFIYRSEKQQCFNIESFVQDAREFQFPSEPTVLYLFNPFPEYVLGAVLANLKASYAATPREIYVLYHNLVHESVFQAQPWLREITRTHQYAVYKVDPPFRP
jgi:hypothetical protein